MIVDALIALSIVIGASFILIGAIGLVRFRDVYSRLHGPTKATTLGLGGLLVASLLYFSSRGAGVSLHEVLVTAFLFLTAPVSAHMLARAGLHLRVPSVTRPPDKRYWDEFPDTVAGTVPPAIPDDDEPGQGD